MTPAGTNSSSTGDGVARRQARLIATLVLLAMVVLVAMSNQARDRALEGERHAYDVTLLTRTSMPASRAPKPALGRFVLDEEVKTSGNIYYSQWRLAGSADPAARAAGSPPIRTQRQRVDGAEQLYRRRGRRNSLSPRARRSPSRAGGTGYFYQAAQFRHRNGTHQQARRDRRERAALARASAWQQSQVLLGRGRPPDRLSELAGRHRRASARSSSASVAIQAIRQNSPTPRSWPRPKPSAPKR